MASKPVCTDAQALERSSERGWLLPYLLALDVLDTTGMPEAPRFTGWHRWDYWLWIIEHNALPANGIPIIPFRNAPDRQDAKAVQDVLQYAARRHYWGYDEAWLQLVRWMLHGFGREGLERDVARIPEDVRARWYREFNLAALLRSPCDWSAFVLQGGLQDDRRKGARWAKSSGFFSTPMEVCAMMCRFTMEKETLHDPRLDTVYDPCVGTGSMLLAASNYSLRLYGQDIVHDLVLCCELNGWLWMPWLVRMPDETRTMLEELYTRQRAILRMRDLLTGKWDGGQSQRHAPPPVGSVVQSKNETTAELAETRAEGARAFYEQLTFIE